MFKKLLLYEIFNQNGIAQVKEDGFAISVFGYSTIQEINISFQNIEIE